MKNSLLQPSLRKKITLGYYAIAALILGASMFTFSELRTLEQKVFLGERTSELFDTTLEIRRFERNYFLHGQTADYQENLRYLASARDFLDGNKADLVTLETPERIAVFRDLLGRYEQHMAEYAAARRNPDQAAGLEPCVRAVGKDIVSISEEIARNERRIVQSSLASFRNILVLSIGGLAVLIIVMGQALSQSVVRPLKEMEKSVDAVSSGRRDNLSPPSRDREIVSIINAFNHMLRELELRQKYLVRSEKLASLGTMLSGVAHELNNPLSNISSSCQILLEEVEKADVDTRKMFLGQIDEQTTRARNIVRSLLDFARDRDFRKESVFLRALVEQTIGFIRGELPPRVSIRIAIPGDIAVFADKQRLQQALLNLIKNAVEVVGEEGDVSITASAAKENGLAWTSGCDVEGEAVDLSIEDNGPGIPAEILPRIFDPFFTTKEVGKGLGLGLFIAYEVVDEHDGCIAVNSEAGKGTVFHIRLPVQAKR